MTTKTTTTARNYKTAEQLLDEDYKRLREKAEFISIDITAFLHKVDSNVVNVVYSLEHDTEKLTIVFYDESRQFYRKQITNIDYDEAYDDIAIAALFTLKQIYD